VVALAQVLFVAPGLLGVPALSTPTVVVSVLSLWLVALVFLSVAPVVAVFVLLVLSLLSLTLLMQSLLVLPLLQLAGVPSLRLPVTPLLTGLSDLVHPVSLAELLWPASLLVLSPGGRALTAVAALRAILSGL
jgi:hypothetical protein